MRRVTLDDENRDRTQVLMDHSEHPLVEFENDETYAIRYANGQFRKLASRLADGAETYDIVEKVIDRDPFLRTGRLLILVGQRRAPLLLTKLVDFLYEIEGNCLAHYRCMDRKTGDGTWLWFPKHDVEHMDARFWACLGIDGVDQALPDHVPMSWMTRLKVTDEVKAQRTFEEHVRTKGKEPYFCVVQYDRVEKESSSATSTSSSSKRRTSTQPTTRVYCRGEGLHWDLDGDPIMMAGQHIDITNLHHQFTQNLMRMSHEIKTPLCSLAGAFELIDGARGHHPPKKKEDGDDMWQICRTSLSQLTSVIGDVILLSQLENGEAQLKLSKKINVRHLIDDVVHLTRSPIAARNQAIHISGPSEDVDVAMCQVHVRIILGNLVSNASKYSKRGSPIRISWACTPITTEGALDEAPAAPAPPPTLMMGSSSSSASENGDDQDERVILTVDVEDQGIGIPEDAWTKVFNQGYRTAASRHHLEQDENCGSQSAGFGLAICDKLSRQMHGDIRVVQSTPHQGTTIRFRLETTRWRPRRGDDPQSPVTSDDEYEYRRRQSIDSQKSDDNHRKPCRVLLVDDVPLNTIVAKRHLEKLGFDDVTAASGGLAAINALNKEHFDLLIVDMHMYVLFKILSSLVSHRPDLDGDDVIRRSDFPRDQTFLWSAAGDVQALRDTATDLGVRVLGKPFTKADKSTLQAIASDALLNNNVS